MSLFIGLLLTLLAILTPGDHLLLFLLPVPFLAAGVNRRAAK